MRATTSLRPPCTPWAIGLLLLLASAGCKPAGTKAPEAQLDDIAAIESELAANRARLESQGVVLTPPGRPSEDRAVADEEGGDATSPKPAVNPPPEPEPEPAPQPTDAPSIASEEADDDAPELESSEHSRDYRSSRKERKNSRRSANRDERTRCERICDLSDNTCDLADKICALADEHVDDVRYEDACDRAEAQCEAATDACTRCEDE